MNIYSIYKGVNIHLNAHSVLPLTAGGAGTIAIDAKATVWGLRCLSSKAWSPRMWAGDATTCLFYLGWLFFGGRGVGVLYIHIYTHDQKIISYKCTCLGCIRIRDRHHPLLGRQGRRPHFHRRERPVGVIGVVVAVDEAVGGQHPSGGVEGVVVQGLGGVVFYVCVCAVWV